MIVKVLTKDLETGEEHNIPYESVAICPRCKTSLIPQGIYAVGYKTYNNFCYTVLNYCPRCQSCFISTYVDFIDRQSHQSPLYFESEPNKYIHEYFPKNISTLSPKFVEIYNQAKCANDMRLDQIAGMGYRKALEFLIKDYAVYMHPNKKTEIEKMLLSNCIKTYVDDYKIKTLAEKSAWLGNDETHYIKVHTDRSVTDLTNFINACCNYIDTELIYEDAKTIAKSALNKS